MFLYFIFAAACCGGRGFSVVVVKNELCMCVHTGSRRCEWGRGGGGEGISALRSTASWRGCRVLRERERERRERERDELSPLLLMGGACGGQCVPGTIILVPIVHTYVSGSWALGPAAN